MILEYVLFHSIDQTRKALKDGVLPSLNLPKKSLSVPPPSPRANSSIKKREESTSSQVDPSEMGITFLEFQQLVAKLKLGNSSSINFSDSFITISSYANDYWLPEFEIFVDPSLRFPYVFLVGY